MVSPVSTNLYTYVGIAVLTLPAQHLDDAWYSRPARQPLTGGPFGMVRPMQVRSAVIPAAGMGTRFLPATKAVPKELLPIGDTPALQLIIDEALGAGIDHIVIVSSRNKPAIEAYFAPAPELHRRARGERRRRRWPSGSAASARDWRVTIVYQDEPRGLGHAVGCAREAVGDEPFAVLLPDELMGDSSLLAQMNGVCAAHRRQRRRR